jgi:hypothetical protein
LVHNELEAVEDFLQSCCEASGVALIDEVWQHLLQAARQAPASDSPVVVLEGARSCRRARDHGRRWSSR